MLRSDKEVMKKSDILHILIDQLKENLNTLVSAALEAKEAATNEESKPENKYDTRGLEASYLAGAQAKRAHELKDAIGRLEKMELQSFKADDRVQLTALVKVSVDDEEERLFFILPFAGGLKVTVGAVEVLVVTPNSPVGQSLLGKAVNDLFEVRTKSKISEYNVVEIR